MITTGEDWLGVGVVNQQRWAKSKQGHVDNAGSDPATHRTCL